MCRPSGSDERADQIGDQPRRKDAAVDLERVFASLADNPVVGDDHAGQRRQKRAHQVEEGLEFAQNSEGCQQGAHRAGNARGDLELALVKAQQVGKRPDRRNRRWSRWSSRWQAPAQQAEERHAQVGEDDGDVVLAGDDAHHAAGEQHEKSCGDHAHDGGLHHIARGFLRSGSNRREISPPSAKEATTMLMPKTSPLETCGS